MVKKAMGRLAVYSVLLIGVLLIFYPIFLMIITSLKTAGEVTGNPTGLPSSIQWSNYLIGFQKAGIGRASLNSAMYTIVSVAGIIVVSAMAAYVVARFNFKGNKFIKFYFVSGLMIPFQVVLIPLFKIIVNLNLYNTMTGVFLIYTAMGIPFAFFLYTGYLRSIPKDIEESAYIDGCSYYRIFWIIILPLTLPATATIIIFNVIYVWNDFFIPLVFLTDKGLRPLQLAIYSLVGEFTTEWNILFASMTMATIPVIVFYIFLQRYFISGLTSGAVKG